MIWLTWRQFRTQALVVLAAVVVVAAALAGTTWWANPLDATVNRSEPDGDFYSFTRLSGTLLGARGMVPVAYLVPALAIGVTAGLVIRRTVPAMAVTLVAVVAVQVCYWQLQWIQTGILLRLAAILTGFCFWRIRRDLT